ncbi:hypothetical protein ACFOYW_06040 [Gryllotalpicola reticulitermitis]|uniref:DNA mismatch repair proteins mutS family domain-containing protein n=1 Tax=Gryllotalpicola reticulitermitis TaxID=1184153 RepID=A0ABV8Q6C5_9MICO
MFNDRDFDPEHAEQPGEADLIQDLDLDTLWEAAAADDWIVRASVRTATLDRLTEPAQIDYRADAFSDCLAHPDVVREMYRLAREAVDREAEIYRATFLRSSDALVRRSVSALQIFLDVLQRLHALAEEHAHGFTSPAFTRLFADLTTELDPPYLAEISEHLRTLRFGNGILASAHLGRHNQGTDYVLRQPLTERQSRFLPHHPPLKRPYYSRTISREEFHGLHALGGLRDRVLRLAATAVSQAAEHIQRFFSALRAELAFYIGCLNVHENLRAKGLRICRPAPQPVGVRALTAADLYDPCLAQRAPQPVQGNDLAADGKRLIMVTGANQGGKSTFLRSLGLAHIMMQAGMPVAAASFAASAVTGIFAHYAREEDPTMTAGKFDEELARMSRIAHRIRPGALLLSNESFATTNEVEASEIATDILRALGEAGVTVAFVTHIYELAHRYERSSTTLFLRAERDASGRRDFRLREAPPELTSYAQDLYRTTFNATSETS